MAVLANAGRSASMIRVIATKQMSGGVVKCQRRQRTRLDGKLKQAVGPTILVTGENDAKLSCVFRWLSHHLSSQLATLAQIQNAVVIRDDTGENQQ